METPNNSVAIEALREQVLPALKAWGKAERLVFDDIAGFEVIPIDTGETPAIGSAPAMALLCTLTDGRERLFEFTLPEVH